MYLSLIKFDEKIGPTIFHTIPEHVDIQIDDILTNMMDIRMDSDYFEFEGDNLKISGFSYEIDSGWNRGKKLSLILMIYAGELFKGKILKVFEPVLQKYILKFQDMTDIFKGFYIDNKKHDEESNEIEWQFEKIHILLQECFKECQNQLFHLYLGHILVLGLDDVGKYQIINFIYKKDFTENESKKTFFKNYVNLLAKNFVFDVHDIKDKAPNVLKQIDNQPSGIIYVLRCDRPKKEFEMMKREFYSIIEYYFSDEKSDSRLSNLVPILILGNCGESAEKFDIEKYHFMFKDSFPKLNIEFRLYSRKDKSVLLDYFFWLFQSIIKNETFDKLPIEKKHLTI